MREPCADKAVEELLALTSAMVDRLEEATAEELEQFVADRQPLVEAVVSAAETAEFRERHRENAERLRRLDAVLMDRMERLRDEAGREIAKQQAARKQASAYQPQYEEESVFFDRRY
ncbi:hypothetical protein ACFQWB_16115 [Paenibacillus thermoaerophilus]|uniref:Flagellar protein FliT n=1 Tax=Paenibacillus thermoaerophilus TaxID=1215385 RepID=A0ABW2V9H6_9BACL|nr:hypothetical protein [Paenibacillus thermoaerophilus]TMV09215.1 hypothetical protein FE781_14875 [Paenibacillus thermoaerophilus]